MQRRAHTHQSQATAQSVRHDVLQQRCAISAWPNTTTTKPVAVRYRKHKDQLFERDVAGKILEMFKDVVLLDYGSVFHRDTHFPQDDLTWFLLEQRL